MYQTLAAAVIALAVGAYGGYEWRDGEAARADAQRLELEKRGEQQTRAAERRQAADVQGAIDASRKREQALRADAAGARAERDGLRHDVDQFKRDTASAPAAACPQRADTAADLFEQCAGALEDLAGKADRHASDALMLQQAWPR